ncbi:hypothetical protein SAMN05216456_2936 [Devosia crocina]|uniref:Clp protease n=1 Tax=Devosia crocina TaxID=429728 RepID=A0A1I7NS81_9HYPH|nr:hypothetical protein [Devosia crocina]SFV37465.1 hypothetical protein SAMN05216456_2936 [Devosia crocina]
MKTEANQRAASTSPGLVQRLAAIDDGAILRFAFFAMLAGTASVLFVDFRELTQNQPVLPGPSLQPILPPAQPLDGPDGHPMPPVTTSPDLLESPLAMDLGQNGELRLTGTIDVGSAQRFAAEIEARGEYVETVVLDSPGGSVMDALEIGSLVHEKGLATMVPAGSLCASSCPLVFAGGAERFGEPQSAIGVHQIYAASLGDGAADALAVAGIAMSDAQSTTARITRYLTDMGVDPALWLHALDTPPERLYYFSWEEMQRLKLVTEPMEN